ncbi:Uncharacterised protein [Sphingobacterium spiritivorum]|uniref:Uncharacterized protein n=1 Tax=Sphingobacterium spiritivorum TaxID=258 RepID=A0A380BUC5_SPHSI|nr:hypothetical protein [Sphingobacterium spiritivorum]SUJ07155.1 Uncharacterised protein [Sphingobacterium spiritivorum]
MRIAGDKTIQEWKELHSKLDISVNDNWDKAFDFFDMRIKTRYLDPIDEILRMKSFSGEGFAVINLQCSLIETIESFVNGWKYRIKQSEQEIERGWYVGEKLNKDITNKYIFSSFFSHRKEFNGKIDGKSFYDFVRCGLLHETQTTNNWKIHRDDRRGELDWYEDYNDYKIIYSYQLNNVLKSLMKRYRDTITNGVQFDQITIEELRKNFIEKMNHICNKS